MSFGAAFQSTCSAGKFSLLQVSFLLKIFYKGFCSWRTLQLTPNEQKPLQMRLFWMYALLLKQIKPC